MDPPASREVIFQLSGMSQPQSAIAMLSQLIHQLTQQLASAKRLRNQLLHDQSWPTNAEVFADAPQYDVTPPAADTEDDAVAIKRPALARSVSVCLTP